MKTTMIILVVCMSCQIIYCQQTIKGTLLDSLNGAPIEFANIGILKESIIADSALMEVDFYFKLEK